MTTLAVDLDRITGDHPRLTAGLVAALFAAGVASLVAVALIWHWNRAGLNLITATYAVMLGVAIVGG
jgi:hypothetical protein